MDPHPLSYTASGGKITQNIALANPMFYLFLFGRSAVPHFKDVFLSWHKHTFKLHSSVLVIARSLPSKNIIWYSLVGGEKSSTPLTAPLHPTAGGQFCWGLLGMFIFTPYNPFNFYLVIGYSLLNISRNCFLTNLDIPRFLFNIPCSVFLVPFFIFLIDPFLPIKGATNNLNWKNELL
jgi:hypothetical protein